MINVCVCFFSLSVFLKPNLIIPDVSLDMPISQRMVYRDGFVHCRGKKNCFRCFSPINGKVMQTGLEKAFTIGIWKWPRSRNRCRLTKRFLAVCTHVCMRLCVSFDLSSLLKIAKTLVGRDAPLVAGSRTPFRIVLCSCVCVLVVCDVRSLGIGI